MVSLGCAKNQVDSEMILGLCQKNGFTIVSLPQEADVILINTCAFIESAREEAINTILDLASFKDEAKKMLVCGCLSERYKEELIEQLPEVDRFISISEYGNIAEIIASTVASSFKSCDKLSPLNRVYATPNYYRYVKISEGCLNRCAFCAIPLIRGKLKSRLIEDIKEEVYNDIKDGVYEINLISQDTTKYGYDIYHKLAITDLLKELCSIEGNFKIRLLYLYPDIVTDELIDFIKNNPKVMPYFDIPIQHSEDKILKKMLRRGGRDYLINLINKIRKEIPNAVIRTTMIVGFPYEEKDDVANLINFVKEVKFDHLGCFTYSKEEGTPSYNYPDIISEDEKNKRYEALMQIQNVVSMDINQKHLNSVLKDCFIVGYDEESYLYMARNYMFAPDDIDGVIYVASKEEHNLGDLINVKILDCDSYTLTGEEEYNG